MAISGQILHSLKIAQLKGISGVECIRFDEKPLTAIMGANGSGKSTILHALACCYQSGEAGVKNWQFRDFFTPTSDSTWSGSSLEMCHSYRDGAEEFNSQVTVYGKAADRWSPRTTRRPYRNVIFIPIKTCVPKIEIENYTSHIRYKTEPHPDAELILRKMSAVFEKEYTGLTLNKFGNGKKYSGLKRRGISYSELAMGAGEQRVLDILSCVYNADKYSLILIDEIDLLLHSAALVNLIRVLYERAESRSLQIVFTTHREVVCDCTKYVSVKHIYNVGEPPKTVVFSDSTPDAMWRLTGKQDRDLLIFVEDDMSTAIVRHVCMSSGMMRHCEIAKFGSDKNSFTLSAGLNLAGFLDQSKHLFVLDGENFKTDDERLQSIKKVLTGTEEGIQERWQACLNTIVSYNPVFLENESPEVQIYRMIKSLDAESVDYLKELYLAFCDMEFAEDSHNYVTQVLDRIGINKEAGFKDAVYLASKSEHWSKYVKPVEEWVLARKAVYAGAD